MGNGHYKVRQVDDTAQAQDMEKEMNLLANAGYNLVQFVQDGNRLLMIFVREGLPNER